MSREGNGAGQGLKHEEQLRDMGGSKEAPFTPFSLEKRGNLLTVLNSCGRTSPLPQQSLPALPPPG